MPRLEITLTGPLLVAGGQAGPLGVDAVTARRFESGRWVPYIPATALRGAVRLELEALLRGARERASGPYPHEEDQGPDSTPDEVASLFGYCGPADARTGALEGCIRFSDALPVDPEAACLALTVRSRVAIDPETSSAAEHKLFFREVADVAPGAPLVFSAHLDTGDAPEEWVRHLRAATEATTAIGAGKAHGGGAVSIRWLKEEAGSTERPGPPQAAQPVGARVTPCDGIPGRARLTLTLREPAHFGEGGPVGNHQATRTWIPGATVRGALAWALLRAGVVEGEDPAFQNLFLGPVSFGDALAAAGPGDEPAVVPATLRKARDDGRLSDRLVTELARERLNPYLAPRGLHLRSDDGPRRFDPLPPRPDPGLLRRLRTRLSIDRCTGTARQTKLFSIEQIEPWIPGKGGGGEEASARQVRFVSWIAGLDQACPEARELLGQLAGLPVFVGAGRNHGQGHVEAHLEPRPDDFDLAAAEARVRALAGALETRTRQLAQRVGVDLPAGEVPPTLPLALVAHGDYLPGPGASHPLAELGSALQPLRSFLNPGAAGGYDTRREKKEKPLKDRAPAIGAGSVFVYAVPEGELQTFLAEILPALARGVGQRTESGCGRFRLFDDLSRKETDHDR